MTQTLVTKRNLLQLASAANVTDAAFTPVVPVDAEPSGAIKATDNLVKAILFGQGIDNATFSARVIGWGRSRSLWVPFHLVTIQATLSAAITGVANNGGTPNGANDYFADTISNTSGDADTKIVNGPSDEAPAYLLVDPSGAEIVTVDFSTGGSAANGNALIVTL